ncbi:hypothetical protein Hte_008115 [Hypoxylon texense]
MIRLINTQTFALEEFRNESDVYGKYAILSHRWSESEVSFQNMNNEDFRRKLADSAEPHLRSSHCGFTKIRETCRLAWDLYGLKYAWIDSCCINRDHHDEKLAAINSMFRWYKKASVCIVHLFEHEDPSRFPTRDATISSESWFRRGWTLQELLAAKKVHFYSRSWQLIGSKVEYSVELEAITGIPQRAIRNEDELKTYSVAQRMSWAAGRKTTEEEDIAYCLFGIFDIVDTSRQYGLGNGDLSPAEEAFRLLQRNIIDKFNDMSIFAWFDPECSESYDILARSPNAFSRCGTFSSISQEPKRTKIVQNTLDITNITETPGAIRLRFTEAPTYSEEWKDKPYWDTKPAFWTRMSPGSRYVLFVAETSDKKAVGICLERITRSLFRRDPKLPLVRMDSNASNFVPFDKCTIAMDGRELSPEYGALSFEAGFRSNPNIEITDAWPSAWWDHANCRLFQPTYYSEFFTLSITVRPPQAPYYPLELEVLCRYTSPGVWSCLLLEPYRAPNVKKALDELRVDQRKKHWIEFERKTEKTRALSNVIYTGGIFGTPNVIAQAGAVADKPDNPDCIGPFVWQPDIMALRFSRMGQCAIHGGAGPISVVQRRYDKLELYGVAKGAGRRALELKTGELGDFRKS